MNCKDPICQADRDTIHAANTELQKHLTESNSLISDIRDVVNEEGHKFEDCEAYEGTKSMNVGKNCPACCFEYRLQRIVSE